MIPIHLLTCYMILDQPLPIIRDQFTDPCNGSERRKLYGLGGPFQSGHRGGSALRNRSEGPPQDKRARLVTPAPPQETAPSCPGRPEGLNPGS